MFRVYVCIGSNVDREKNVALALEKLRTLFGDLHVSSIYESDSVGFDGDPFLNIVAGFDSGDSPRELISKFRGIESECGRTRDDPRFGPRTLDIDLLLYGDKIIDCDGLLVPRKEITRYAFVLRPLAEIAGQRRHPVIGQTYDRLWSEFDVSGQRAERVAGSIAELFERNHGQVGPGESEYPTARQEQSRR